MVRIRLKRLGMKKAPFYRIVVADGRNARDGRFIEQIGYFNPLTEPNELKIDLERVNYWVGVGAQPTDTVRALIKKAAAMPAPTPVMAKPAPAPEAPAVETASEE